ncbi:MAG TPA: acyl carrier protein phosphodiesterase, partial [Armatimonadota bacterium]|nr:acyl carrier protein phosphodiesterase [Armatimonadota bacterium]
GRDLSQYPERVQFGITLHRRIDAFADAHPVFGRSRRRIAPGQRRYAGVLVDLFYDHFLACRWEQYAGEPLDRFCDRTYALLREEQPRLPHPLDRVAGAMVEQDWLRSYQEIAGIRLALERMARRIRPGYALAPAVEDLQTLRAQFEADFHGFFPDLVGHVRQVRAGYPGGNLKIL